MGYQLGPTLANVSLPNFEEKWIFGFTIDYKPVSYKKYADYTFLLFSSELHVTK